MEKIIAESLLEISQITHEDCGITTYHVCYLPRRIYIEAPGIVEIQEFMKFSVYGHLVSHAAVRAYSLLLVSPKTVEKLMGWTTNLNSPTG